MKAIGFRKCQGEWKIGAGVGEEGAGQCEKEARNLLFLIYSNL